VVESSSPGTNNGIYTHLFLMLIGQAIAGHLQVLQGVPQVTSIVASSSMSPDASMAGCNGCLDGEPWRFGCGPNGISRQQIACVMTGAEMLLNLGS
jgi:hypothetical protein